MFRLAHLPPVLALAVSLVGCDPGAPAAEPSLEPTIRGTVSYRERMALTPQAELEVRLLELPSSGGPAPVIGLIRIQNPGQVPITFQIPFDPQQMDPEARHAIQADIRDQGRTLFTTPHPIVVLQAQHNRPVDLVLHRVATSASASAPRYECQGSEPVWQVSIEGERLRFHSFLARPVRWDFQGRYRVQGPAGGTSVVWHGVDSVRPVHRLTAWITEQSCRPGDGSDGRDYAYAVSITLPDVNVVRGCCTLAGPQRLAAAAFSSAIADDRRRR